MSMMKSDKRKIKIYVAKDGHRVVSLSISLRWIYRWIKWGLWHGISFIKDEPELRAVILDNQDLIKAAVHNGVDFLRNCEPFTVVEVHSQENDVLIELI